MKKYHLGIVFSGGGAKAAAHCGALQALKEYGVKADVLAGTSAGAMVAAFHSAGIEPKRMIELCADKTFFRDMATPSRPRGGIFDSSPMLNFIRENMPYRNIEDLPVPVHIVASDMDHGKVKVFSKGEIAPRLVASCSIPVMFKPMVIGGVHYIDGGVFQNLPVPTIRNMCEEVIAFSVRRMEEEKYKDSLLFTATRAYSMMFMSNIMADSRLADHFIELNTDGYSVYDLSKTPELFRQGYADACRALENIGYERIMPPESIEFNIPEEESEDRQKRLRARREYFEERVRELSSETIDKISERIAERAERRAERMAERRAKRSGKGKEME